MFTIHSGLDSMRTFLNPHPHPFGMLTPGRSWEVGVEYRYGFNGQAQDNEVYSSGNLNTAEYWQYDSRLGRRWNMDPVSLGWRSSYSCFNNNPIYFTDRNGAIPIKVEPNKDGEYPNTSSITNKFDGIFGPLSGGPILIGGASGKREGAGSGEDSQSSVKGEPGSMPITPEEDEEASYSYNEIMFQSNFSEERLRDHFVYPLYCGADNRASETACNDMYKTMNRFLSGQGGTFSDYYSIQSDMANNSVGIETKNQIQKEFINQMKMYNGDYTKINILNVYPTDYSGASRLLSAVPGGTQTIIIYLNAITIHNNTFSAEISYELLDDFGVAQRDVKKHFWPDLGCAAVDGLAAFWVLQHQYGYKPLLNIYTIKLTVNGEF